MDIQPDDGSNFRHGESAPHQRRINNYQLSHVNNSQAVQFEGRVGILHRVSPLDFGWTGRMRVRYTDFQVHEILHDGQVVHLTSYEVPVNEAQTLLESSQQQPEASPNEVAITESTVSDEDRKILVDLVGPDTTVQLLELSSQISKAKVEKQRAHGSVLFGPVDDKTKRGNIHQAVRRIFAGQIETAVNDAKEFKATPSNHNVNGGRRTGNRNKKRDGPSFEQLGGNHLHFTVYKENKDTMDAMGQIARITNIPRRNFGFAGTKDKRAATSQRMSLFRKRPGMLARVNKVMEQSNGSIFVGDFEFQKYELGLGDLRGNEFVITLKDCRVVRASSDYSIEHKAAALRACVAAGMKSVARHGFLNYYGLQRFGTFDKGTHEVGAKLLQQNFLGAINLLLDYDPCLLTHDHTLENIPASFRDEIKRAKACATFVRNRTPDSAASALQLLHPRFVAETAILKHFAQPSAINDYCGAVVKIPRTLRNLYLHGYQAYVWNHIASRRWALYGRNVVAGDVVQLTQQQRRGEVKPAEASHPTKSVSKKEQEIHKLDQDGDIIVEPSAPVNGQDTDSTAVCEKQYRLLTAEDIERDDHGFTIFDVVLPLPGSDIAHLYPRNAVGEYYAEFMARAENGGMDPHDMHRPQREFRLKGDCRRLMGTFMGSDGGDAVGEGADGAGNPTGLKGHSHYGFQVHIYEDDDVKLAPTDLDLLRASRKNGTSIEGDEAARKRRQCGTTVDESDPQQKRRKLDGDAEVMLDNTNGRSEESVVEKNPPVTMAEELNKQEGGKAEGSPKIDAREKTPAPASPYEGNEKKLAVVLRFQLRSSSYATMAIRELASTAAVFDTAVPFKADEQTSSKLDTTSNLDDGGAELDGDIDMDGSDVRSVSLLHL